jgi:hypothetical protein
MKYRPTPFNISTAIFIAVIIWYFINSNKNPNFDKHGWNAVFTLIPSFFIGGILIISDLVIQSKFRTKKYQWILIIEGLIILGMIICFWSWVKMIFFPFLHLPM